MVDVDICRPQRADKLFVVKGGHIVNFGRTFAPSPRICIRLIEVSKQNFIYSSYTHAVNSVSQVELCSSTELNLKTFTYRIDRRHPVLQLPILDPVVLSCVVHNRVYLMVSCIRYVPLLYLLAPYMVLRVMDKGVPSSMTACKRPETRSVHDA